MANLIDTIGKLQAHITVSGTFDFDLVLPYCKRAERKFIVPEVFYDQYIVFTEHDLVEESNEPIDRVVLLLQEASANFGLLLAVPFLNLQITNYGLKTTKTTQSENADWKDIRDLKRYLLETANEALDDALQIMEDNATDFSDWKNSEVFTYFKSSLVRHTREFQEGFDICNNRKTFRSLKNYMKEVEEQYFLPMLGKPTLNLIKEVSANETMIRVQELCRLGMVALTVAKVAVTGKFSFTATSFIIKTDELPWEKSKIELTPENQENLRKDRQNAGQEYLKKIKKTILENPTLFPDYVDDEEKPISTKIINKKSHLFL